MKINTNYTNLTESYLFSQIAQKIRTYQEAHPGQEILRLGIGDVTQPLVPAVLAAMQQAVAEMGMRRRSAGMEKNRGMNFCGRPSADTIKRKASRWKLPRYLSVTVPKATWAIFWTFFRPIIRS